VHRYGPIDSASNSLKDQLCEDHFQGTFQHLLGAAPSTRCHQLGIYRLITELLQALKSTDQIFCAPSFCLVPLLRAFFAPIGAKELASNGKVSIFQQGISAGCYLAPLFSLLVKTASHFCRLASMRSKQQTPAAVDSKGAYRCSFTAWAH
jgi:hypothetical protein